MQHIRVKGLEDHAHLVPHSSYHSRHSMEITSAQALDTLSPPVAPHAHVHTGRRLKRLLRPSGRRIHIANTPEEHIRLTQYVNPLLLFCPIQFSISRRICRVCNCHACFSHQSQINTWPSQTDSETSAVLCQVLSLTIISISFSTVPLNT